MKQTYIQEILKNIPEKSKVLDLGCSNGTLLEKLLHTKNVNGYGIEIQFEKVVTCTKKGIPVYQGDILEGLQQFADHSFDTVILSQTLQETKEPKKVIKEMVRVGKRAIISFPNFAHWKNRLHLLAGTSPQTSTLPYEWYNTPNIRVITLKEFKKLCKDENYTIIKESPLYNSALLRTLIPKTWANLLSKRGLFIIQA